MKLKTCPIATYSDNYEVCIHQMVRALLAILTPDLAPQQRRNATSMADFMPPTDRTENDDRPTKCFWWTPFFVVKCNNG